ncbi:MAG: hypothetical protein ACRDTC_04090 [Pseudonocardiaceae bacterium]
MRSKAGALTWLASGVGAIGSTLMDLGMQSALLVLGLIIAIPLAVLPLLITALALVAVYDCDPQRRAAAAKVLDRLLVSLRSGQRHGR